jgi:hypothetical protein
LSRPDHDRWTSVWAQADAIAPPVTAKRYAHRRFTWKRSDTIFATLLIADAVIALAALVRLS